MNSGTRFYHLWRGLSLSLAVFLLCAQQSVAVAEESVTERSEAAERLLLDIVLRQERLFEILGERPDFFTPEALAAQVEKLLDDYTYYNRNHPDDVMALILEAKLLQVTEQREAAIKLYLRADALDPDIPVVKQQIGNYFAEESRPIAALPFIFRAVDLAPEEPVYHYQLGELLHTFRDDFIDEGVLTEADLDISMQRSFREASALLPGDFDLFLRYAESFHDVANPAWEDALAHLHAGEARFTDAFREEVILLHQGRAFVEMNRFDEAAEALGYVRHSALRKTRDALLKRIEDARP